MPKLKLTVSLPQLDRERYLSDLQASVRQAVIKAARKFLLAAVPRIPIWTGMARSAFANLEDIAGRVDGDRIRGTLGGVSKLKLLQKKSYYYYPPGGGRILRTNISGRQFATPKDKILGEGNLTLAKTKSRMVFKFQVDISYFNFLDKEKWGAFEAGKAAFNQELKFQLERLRPRIGDYFIKREIK